MLKHDKEILWRPGRLYIPAWQFTGLAYDPTVVVQIRTVGTGTAATGNMEVAEINTSGVTGVNFTTAANSINTLVQVPADMDLTQPIYGSVYWTANNTSGSTRWDLTHKAFIPNTTVLGTAEAAVAFDAALAAHTMAGVAYTLMRTPEARINGAKFPDTTEVIQFKVAMGALVTITTTFFVGLSLRYTPKRLQGNTGMLNPAKPATYIASNKY